MGNRQSLVSISTFPGPKSKFSEVYDVLVTKGVIIKERDDPKSEILDVTLPEGWSMFTKNGNYQKQYYLFDNHRTVQAVFFEIDEDKYRDYKRTVDFWDEYQAKRVPFTYPLPDFYIIQDGYLVMDKQSSFAQELSVVKNYHKQYENYIENYNKLTTDTQETLRTTLVDQREKIRQLSVSPYTKEYSSYTYFFDRVKDGLPITPDEIATFMTTLYRECLKIKQGLIQKHYQVNESRKNFYEKFFEYLKHYSEFLTRTFDKNIISEYYKEDAYLKLPDDISLIFTVKNTDTIEKDKAIAEMTKLVNEYYRIADYVSGCGSRVQGQLDDHYQKIQDHVKDHPEVSNMMPKRIRSTDDGYGGTMTGLSRLGSYY